MYGYIYCGEKMESEKYCWHAKKKVILKRSPLTGENVCSESFSFREGDRNAHRCKKLDCSYHEDIYVLGGLAVAMRAMGLLRPVDYCSREYQQSESQKQESESQNVILCPHCQKRLLMRVEHAGQKAACWYCKKVFMYPSSLPKSQS